MKNFVVAAAALSALVALTPAYAEDDVATAWRAACNTVSDDFAGCYAALKEQEKAIAAEKRLNTGNAVRTQELIEAEARTGNAVSTFDDFTARHATLRDAKEALDAIAARMKAPAIPREIAEYEKLRADELTATIETLRVQERKARAAAYAYARLAQEGYRPIPIGKWRPESLAQSEGETTGDCARMIDAPSASYYLTRCKAVATAQSARTIPGGELKVPGSVLNPPGFSAVLSGGESGGGATLTFSRKFNRRSALAPGTADNAVVPRPWNWGASIGLKAGDGNLFTRDTALDNDFDQISSKAALTASLYFDVYEGETKKEWGDRAKKMKAGALNACRADQTSASPTFVSTCAGGSLTDWVYAVDKDGKQLHKEAAESADALYFSGKYSVPRWGGGIATELGRSSHPYVLPAVFQSTFTGKFDDAFKQAAVMRSSSWVASVSPYLYVRITPPDAKVGLSFIPSYTIATTLGYDDGHEKVMFCPTLDTTAPFTTSACRKYNDKAPDFERVQTVAGELRSAFTIPGNVSMIASPKFSWNDQDREDAHPWHLSLPVLAFTDLAKTSAVGVKLDWAFGRFDTVAGETADDDLAVKLVYQKSFSLTGQ